MNNKITTTTINNNGGIPKDLGIHSNQLCRLDVKEIIKQLWVNIQEADYKELEYVNCVRYLTDYIEKDRAGKLRRLNPQMKDASTSTSPCPPSLPIHVSIGTLVFSEVTGKIVKIGEKNTNTYVYINGLEHNNNALVQNNGLAHNNGLSRNNGLAQNNGLSRNNGLGRNNGLAPMAPQPPTSRQVPESSALPVTSSSSSSLSYLATENGYRVQPNNNFYNASPLQVQTQRHQSPETDICPTLACLLGHNQCHTHITSNGNTASGIRNAGNGIRIGNGIGSIGNGIRSIANGIENPRNGIGNTDNGIGNFQGTPRSTVSIYAPIYPVPVQSQSGSSIRPNATAMHAQRMFLPMRYQRPYRYQQPIAPRPPPPPYNLPEYQNHCARRRPGRPPRAGAPQKRKRLQESQNIPITPDYLINAFSQLQQNQNNNSSNQEKANGESKRRAYTSNIPIGVRSIIADHNRRPNSNNALN